MNNFIKNAYNSVKEYLSQPKAVSENLLTEQNKNILEATDLARQYWFAAKAAGVNVPEDRSHFQKKEVERIIAAGQIAIDSMKKSIKFFEYQSTAINSYNAEMAQYKKLVNLYQKKVGEYVESSNMSPEEKIKFLEKARNMNENTSFIIGLTKNPEFQKLKYSTLGISVAKQGILNRAEAKDAADYNIKSYSESLSPDKVVDGWHKIQGVGTSAPIQGKLLVVDRNGKGIYLNEEDKDTYSQASSLFNADELIKKQEEIISENKTKEAEASLYSGPTTNSSKKIREAYEEYKKNNYRIVEMKDNVLTMQDDSTVVSVTSTNGVDYILQTNKKTGTQELTSSNSDGSGETVSVLVGQDNQSVVDSVFSGAKNTIEMAKNSKIKDKTPEEAAVIEKEIINPSPENKPQNAPGEAQEQKMNTSSGSKGIAQPGQPIKPEQKEIYRVKSPNGLPDKIFDAKTGQQIPGNKELLANYSGAKEVSVPDNVKTIYRDGQKIFDGKTGKQIINEQELANYKGAIEIAKPKTDEEYLSEMKAEMSGKTRADGQPMYSDDQIKSMAEEYKNGNYKNAAEAFAAGKDKVGKANVESGDTEKRKFSKIAKNADGSIKLDSNGKPVSEDFYLSVYTKDELDSMSDENKNKVRDESKKQFLAKGGTEEEWSSSKEFQAVEDVLTNAASADELQRSADLGARKKLMPGKIKEEASSRAQKLAGDSWSKLTPEEQSAKIKEEEDKLSVEYKNNQGKTEYNISEDVNITPADKTILPKKTTDETDKKKETDNENPWATNSNKKKIKELRFVEEQKNDLSQKGVSYRKRIKEGRLGGIE